MKKDKKRNLILTIIVITPIFLFIMDYYNIPSKTLNNYRNLTDYGTWLTTIATFSSSIISAMLLLIITEKDRKENTKVIRESQRPYLDVSYMIVKKKEFKRVEKLENYICFAHGSPIDKEQPRDKYVTLQIVNNGASVAILEISKIIVELQYSSGEIKNIQLSPSINRLTIRSGSTVYIKFCDSKFYKDDMLLSDSKIIHSIIYYKDLFNKEYLDECKLTDNLIVLHDNEEI